jgi:MFS family permease
MSYIVNLSLINWSAAPEGATPTQKKNFYNVQMDAVGVGLASAAAPFLPVFLTRLGATNFQVSLLTAMPAFTGLFLAIAVGRFLSRRNVVPWFSRARLLIISCYALTGVLSWIVPNQHAVPAVLAIWAMATIPQTMVSVAFSVVMNAVAGPGGRYLLMSRRWSILGLTSAITVTVAGQILNRLSFPTNYQLVFIGLAVGGLISFYFSSHIELPDVTPMPRAAGLSLSQRFRSYANLIRTERAFVSFTIKRFVYLSGATLAAPLFPIYYVREVQATDAWIGVINSIQTAVMLMGYIVWARQGKNRGSRFVLLWTTLGLALYPALVASTHRVQWIALYAGLAGIFQAGLDLVFFDELMKTVPVQHSATFVSLAQSLQYLSAAAAPLLGTLLASHVGIGGALVASGLIRLVGFGLFAWGKTARSAPTQAPPAPAVPTPLRRAEPRPAGRQQRSHRSPEATDDRPGRPTADRASS